MSDTRHPEKGPDPMTLGRETSACWRARPHNACFRLGFPRASPTSPPTERRVCWQRGSTGPVRSSRCRPFLAAPHVRHAPGRLRALRANPNVAVTIDTETFPPEVLTMRGRVEISEVEGVPAEYAAAARRYLGEEAASAYLEQIDQPGTRMARIDLRPSWVGVHDFQSRLPSALGGIA
jgi:hypothetical protein